MDSTNCRWIIYCLFEFVVVHNPHVDMLMLMTMMMIIRFRCSFSAKIKKNGLSVIRHQRFKDPYLFILECCCLDFIPY